MHGTLIKKKNSSPLDSSFSVTLWWRYIPGQQAVSVHTIPNSLNMLPLIMNRYINNAIFIVGVSDDCESIYTLV